MDGINVILTLRQVILFVFDRSQQPLPVAVPPGFTKLGHADPHVAALEQLRVGNGCLLDSLVGVIFSVSS